MIWVNDRWAHRIKTNRALNGRRCHACNSFWNKMGKAFWIYIFVRCFVCFIVHCGKGRRNDKNKFDVLLFAICVNERWCQSSPNTQRRTMHTLACRWKTTSKPREKNTNCIWEEKIYNDFLKRYVSTPRAETFGFKNKRRMKKHKLLRRMTMSNFSDVRCKVD